MEAPQPATPRPNPFSRLAGALFSPEKTFSSIARQPDILVPLILFMVWSLISGVLIAQKVDFLSEARAQMARQNIPPEQAAQQLKWGGAFAKVIAYTAPITTVILFAFVAAMVMLSFRLMGGEGEFKHYFSVTIYAWMPRLVQGVIMTIILLTRSSPVGVQELATIVHSNPAFLVDPETHRMLFTFLSAFDLFAIWSLILMIIGFAHVAKVSKARSATIMVTLWVIVLGVKMVPAAFASMMGPRK